MERGGEWVEWEDALLHNTMCMEGGMEGGMDQGGVRAMMDAGGDGRLHAAWGLGRVHPGTSRDGAEPRGQRGCAGGWWGGAVVGGPRMRPGWVALLTDRSGIQLRLSRRWLGSLVWHGSWLGAIYGGCGVLPPPRVQQRAATVGQPSVLPTRWSRWGGALRA